MLKCLSCGSHYQRVCENCVQIARLGSQLPRSLGEALKAPLNSASGGTKHDAGKVSLSLIPRAALEQEAKVYAFGANKYGRDNYKKGFAYTRLIDAALRHIMAAVDGEDIDAESGEAHLAHARCCIGMLMEIIRLGTVTDDRFNKGAK